MKLKRILAVLLAALLLNFLPLLIGASEERLPESAHDYANNADETWTYVSPEQTDRLFVTFSERTYFMADYIVQPYADAAELSEETLRELAENGYIRKESSDLLHVYDASGALYGTYTGGELAGVTLWLPGDRFTLELVTDGALTAYGFSIDRISPEPPADTALVRYHIGGESVTLTAGVGEAISLDPYYRLRQNGDEMIVGWRTADGRAWRYDPSIALTQTDLIAEAGGAYDLYPVTCKLGLRQDEVYSFLNSDDVFDDGYYYENKHFYQSAADWMGTFGVTPFMPLAAAAIVFFSVYWPTLEFYGSCCGFPITELLQHYGKIDLLSRQGVETVSELEPDAELTSLINFYNNQCVACHLVNNVALDPGTEAYTAQLRAMYEKLEQGIPVYFEFYPDYRHPMAILAEGAFDELGGFDSHGILLTGAYTTDDGDHILIACDCNYSDYVRGGCNTVRIDRDFTKIVYKGEELQGFSWNDDVSAFDSFKAEGISNPFAWHIAFFRHFLDTLKQIIAILKK